MSAADYEISWHSRPAEPTTHMTADPQQQFIGAAAALTGFGVGCLLQRPSLLMAVFTAVMGAIAYSLLNR